MFSCTTRNTLVGTRTDCPFARDRARKEAFLSTVRTAPQQSGRADRRTERAAFVRSRPHRGAALSRRLTGSAGTARETEHPIACAAAAATRRSFRFRVAATTSRLSLRRGTEARPPRRSRGTAPKCRYLLAESTTHRVVHGAPISGLTDVRRSPARCPDGRERVRLAKERSVLSASAGSFDLVVHATRWRGHSVKGEAPCPGLSAGL